jgi:ABC-type Fe3+-siderophore transport system permease subunit
VALVVDHTAFVALVVDHTASVALVVDHTAFVALVVDHIVVALALVEERIAFVALALVEARIAFVALVEGRMAEVVVHIGVVVSLKHYRFLYIYSVSYNKMYFNVQSMYFKLCRSI